TGISEVRIALDANPDQGGVPVSASYGLSRSDIAELLGDDRYTPSGFSLSWDSSSAAPGSHALYIQVRSACGWTGTARRVTVAGGAAAAAPAAPAAAVASGGSAPEGGTFTFSPSSVPAGGTLTVSWSGLPNPCPTDWVALYPASSTPDMSYVT